MSNPREMLNQLQFKLNTSNFTDRIGFLDEEVADRFIDLTVNQSVLLQACRVERVRERAGEFPTFEFPYPVLRRRGTPIPPYSTPRNYTTESGGQGLAYEGGEWTTETGTFNVGSIKYSCSKVVTYFTLTWEMLNWNIMQDSFEDFIVQKWSQRMKEDLELFGLQGDSTIVPSGETDYLGHLLSIDDGWIKLVETAAVPGQIINWVDAGGNPKPIDHTLFQVMRKNLPSRWVTPGLTWIATPRVVMDYMHYLSDRGDALGAAMLFGAQEPRPEGITFFNGRNAVPYMPEEASGDDTLTKIVLTDPKHFWLVIHREFRLETQREPRLDSWYWIGHGYIDAIVDFPQAVVLAKNVKYA